MLNQYTVSLTTNAAGGVTAYSQRITTGRIVALKYEPGTIATDCTVTMTGETSEVAVLTKASPGASDVWYYPQAISNQVSDGAASAITEVPVHLYSERLKVVVTSGGNAASGEVTLYIDE